MEQTHTIVVVEDSDTQFLLVEAVLADLPVTVRRAATGEQAIEVLSDNKPDLLLLDILLPDMRGWDVLDRLADGEALKDVPILVLTSRTEMPHRIIAKLQGVAVYMNKPFDPQDLRNKVGELLGLT